MAYKRIDDYRKSNEKEEEKYVISQLSKLLSLKKLGDFVLTDVLIGFDATSLYHSAMWHEKSIYPEIVTGYASAPNKNIEVVEKVNTQTFTESSAFLEVLNHNPSNLLFQHVPVRQKVKKTLL